MIAGRYWTPSWTRCSSSPLALLARSVRIVELLRDEKHDTDNRRKRHDGNDNNPGALDHFSLLTFVATRRCRPRLFYRWPLRSVAVVRVGSFGCFPSGGGKSGRQLLARVELERPRSPKLIAAHRRAHPPLLCYAISAVHRLGRTASPLVLYLVAIRRLVHREDLIMCRTLITAVAVAGVSVVGWALLPATAQQPTVQRKVLITQDLPIPGYQSVMASVELPVGGREGRHTHPGAGFAYVLEGSITLEHEGRQTMTYKAGDAVYIEANKVHEGINAGSAPVKLVATFVVEKGKPLASPAP